MTSPRAACGKPMEVPHAVSTWGLGAVIELLSLRKQYGSLVAVGNVYIGIATGDSSGVSLFRF